MNADAADIRLRRRLLAASARLAVLDLDDYVALNGDLTETSPLQHFARYGVWERRRCILPETRTARLAEAARLAPKPAPLSAETAAHSWRIASGLTVDLRLPSNGLPCATSVLLERRLADVGVCVRFLNGKDRPPPTPREVEILMDAPAVFGGERPKGEAADRLGHAVVWVSGAPGGVAFNAALPYALGARGVICEEAESCAVFAHAGLPTLWLGEPLLDLAVDEVPDHPLVAGLSRRVREAPANLPWSERPIEIAALEDATWGRSHTWRHLVEPLAARAHVVRRPAGPDAHLPHELELRRFIYARSRLVLHTHADQPCAIDSRTMSEAANAGSVLLTEMSPPHFLLKPNLHYAETDIRRVGVTIEDLLDNPRQSVRIAEGLRRTLAWLFSPERIGLHLVLLCDATRREA